MSKRVKEVEYMCYDCRRSDADDYLHRYTIDYINKINPYVFNIPNEYEDGDLDEIFIYLIHTQTGQDLMKKFQSIIIHYDILQVLDPFIKDIFAPSFVKSKTNIEALQYIKEHNPTQIQQYLAKFKYCTYMLSIGYDMYQWINTVFYGFEFKKEFFKIVGKDLLCEKSLDESLLNFTYINKIPSSAEKIKLLEPFYGAQDLEFYTMRPKIRFYQKHNYLKYEYGRLLIYNENVYSKLKKHFLSFKDDYVGKYYKQRDMDTLSTSIEDVKCGCCGESMTLNNVFKYECCNVYQCMICVFKKLNEFDKKRPTHLNIYRMLDCPQCQKTQKYFKVFNVTERSTPSPSFEQQSNISVQISEFERCPSILESDASGYFDLTD